MKIRKARNIIIAAGLILVLIGSSTIFIQNVAIESSDPFAESRQKMANELLRCRDSANTGDWNSASSHFSLAKKIWNDEVKTEFSKRDDYKDRASAVESDLSALENAIKNRDAKGTAVYVNKTIWNISAQPQGFKIEPVQYTIWDWILALSIGIGFNIACVVAGLHLRKTYRRGA